MEEKIIIKSNKNGVKPVFIIASYVIAVALVIIGIVLYETWSGFSFRYKGDLFYDHMLFPFESLPGLSMDLGLILAIVATIMAFSSSPYELTVTNKRVLCTVSSKIQMTLSLDSISYVATGNFQSIEIASPSGKIIVNSLNNNYEICKAVKDLIDARRDASAATSTNNGSISDSNADKPNQ